MPCRLKPQLVSPSCPRRTCSRQLIYTVSSSGYELMVIPLSSSVPTWIVRFAMQCLEPPAERMVSFSTDISHNCRSVMRDYPRVPVSYSEALPYSEAVEFRRSVRVLCFTNSGFWCSTMLATTSYNIADIHFTSSSSTAASHIVRLSFPTIHFCHRDPDSG
jgi:hypothetical protein